MAYLKAGVLALLAAIGLGAATGIWRALKLALDLLRPEDRAMVLAPSISEAVNCAAFCAIMFVPIGLLGTFVLSRWRGRHGAEPRPG